MAAIHTIEIVAQSGFQPATRLGSAIFHKKREKRRYRNEQRLGLGTSIGTAIDHPT